MCYNMPDMKRMMIVTAGPTREHLDPVRFLSNPSTGKMGFALAAAGAAAGFDVRLVAGPVALATPKGVKRTDIVSAREMLVAVRALLREATDGLKPVFIATAAVADWRPARIAAHKLKKAEMSGTLHLVRNPDILKSVHGAVKVGFAAETDRVLAEAARKCREKKLAFIVANDITKPGTGFGTETNRVTLVFPDGRTVAWPLMTKRRVATRIVRTIADLEM